MIKRIEQLKSITTQRTNYYSNIGFDNLANEYSNLLNILNEMENIIKENEELKAQIQLMEEKAREKVLQARIARDGEECCD